MEISLNYPPSKDLPNGYTITSNEREFRPYAHYTEAAITRQLPIKELEASIASSKVLSVMEICSMRKELIIRKHPDYEQYHKDWLVVFKEREQEWKKECQEREKRIDIEIAKLQEKRTELRNPK